MSASWGPAVEWWLALAGWSALVALWHTSAIALAVATWRVWRPAAPARRVYAVAGTALALALVSTAATPVVIAELASPRNADPSVTPVGASSVQPGIPPRSGAPRGSVALPSPLAAAVTRSLAPIGGTRRVASWFGAVWILGAIAGVARLAGGLALARRIRRRARPLSDGALAARADAVCGTLPSRPRLFTSEHVDAPVVLGHRAPVILLPREAEVQLAPDALEPLLAHELAHIERRDYAANLAQSAADAMLFFSPGSRWLSRTIRDAREFCCDDAVAARCGAGPYVQSLTTLAGLGAAARSRPALNAAGPRLIVRIRRLLQEDAMPRYTRFRVVGVAAALALVSVGGGSVVPLSAQSVASSGRVVFVTPIEGPIPMGFIRTQHGASVRLTGMTTSDAASCDVATVENHANVAVIGLRFAAFAHAAGPALSFLSVGSVAMSDPVAVDLPPQGRVDVPVRLLSLADLQGGLRTGSPQVLCAIAEIRYANGASWSSPPASIFGPEHVDVPRTLVGGTLEAGAPICKDDVDRDYSEGAIVPIRHEPGAFARCRDGAWAEYSLPPMRPTPAP